MARCVEGDRKGNSKKMGKRREKEKRALKEEQKVIKKRDKSPLGIKVDK